MAKVKKSPKYIQTVLKDWKLVNGKWVKVYHKKEREKARKKGPKKPTAKQVLRKRVKACRERTAERLASIPSVGEQRIINFLTENGVYFEREYHNPKLFNPETNHMLYFDFYVPKYHLLIEFDGIHHFKPVHGEAELKRQKAKDKVKNRWCAARDWPLLRISCFQMDEIEELICLAFDKIDPIPGAKAK